MGLSQLNEAVIDCSQRAPRLTLDTYYDENEVSAIIPVSVLKASRISRNTVAAVHMTIETALPRM